jgi:hypothetical protein
MSDAWIIRTVLFVGGLIPFTALDGWGATGDHSMLPWLAGFGTQAGVVLGFIAQRRGWWKWAR